MFTTNAELIWRVMKFMEMQFFRAKDINQSVAT